MKKIKRICITLSIFVSLTQPGFCLIGEIISLGKWVAGQFNEITEEVFRKSMVAKTVESVAILKKNYEDSMRFYKEIKQIQENPYGLLEETRQQFLTSLENPVDKFWTEVDKKQREIDSKEKKKWYEKGIASYAEEKTIGAGLEYVKSNWNFGDRIVEAMQQQNKRMEEIVNKLNSKDKAKVEDAKLEIELMQLQTQQQTNALLLKFIEIQNRQIEEQLLQRQMVLQKQQLFAKTAEELLRSKLEKQKPQERKSREQYIKKLLEATSEREVKK